MGIILKEHRSLSLDIRYSDLTEDLKSAGTLFFAHKEDWHTISARPFKTERGKVYPCYELTKTDDKITVEAGYFVGIDWLWQAGNRTVRVEPKINSTVYKYFEKLTDLQDESLIEKESMAAEENIARDPYEKEVDCVAMLMEIMSYPDVAKETGHLLLIDWKAKPIRITQKQDLLTPFLVVRFLMLLRDIVKKGLKKSYYKTEENLRNRIKGKILVGKQIRQNILKNRFTDAVCEYQIFGEDSPENRFLKKVFSFCRQYVENDPSYFKDRQEIRWILGYIRPAFEHIGEEISTNDISSAKYNPFFKEYQGAIKVGQLLLKKTSYNITKAAQEEIYTPPFWIDMPKLFELFVYARLLKDNPEIPASQLNYQFPTYGNSLDFLICSEQNKIVVDTKYKLRYNYGHIHEDIRQVSGYARLKKVKDQPPGIGDEEISCIIIYPNPDLENVSLRIGDLMDEKHEIKAYHKIYKIGIPLPYIK
ncbi:5-methylcytosine restriction system specificity protein McrC [Chryseobacterium gossypii]|uniref:5-methylcytosine restriction system specificity protein McrC n=1 Tax=Chryseobacterium gossypii TaxID=3231602 RepID=UPI0035249DC1